MSSAKQTIFPAVEGFKPPRQKRSAKKVEAIKVALIELLRTKSFKDISNIDISDAAGLKNVQSLYQYFEDGKNTIISVLAVESHLAQQKEIIAFFSGEGRVAEPLEDIIRGLNRTVHSFYKRYPEWVTILHDPDIPLSLRGYRDVMREAGGKMGAEFLKARGYGSERHVLALMINDVMYFIHEKSVSLHLRNNQLEVEFDYEVEDQLEIMIIRYLQPLDPIYSR